jgi:hypothetical protein
MTHIAVTSAVSVRSSLCRCSASATRRPRQWPDQNRSGLATPSATSARPPWKLPTLLCGPDASPYADPTWTLTSGPSSDHRPPQQLAPDPDTFTRTVAAVHQAASTLTTLAAADYTQIRTAARTGRLLVPATQVPASAKSGGLYDRAPRRRANDLLTAYLDADTSSVKATAKIAAITADHQARDRQPGRRPATSPKRQPGSGRILPAATIALTEPDMPPGPIKRMLFDLGVTDPELLNRGTSLDKAASQLIAEAADRTAPQRWHGAVVRPGALTNQ